MKEDGSGWEGEGLVEGDGGGGGGGGGVVGGESSELPEESSGCSMCLLSINVR